MYTLNDALSYYWRVFSNFEFGTIGLFGLLHSISFLGLLTFCFLFFLAVLILKANPQEPKNRFMALMLLVEGSSAGILTLFWLYPWPAEAMTYLFPFRGVVGFLSIARVFLYFSVPAFYLPGKISRWVRESYGNWMILMYPMASFVLTIFLIQYYGGLLATAGDMVSIGCTGVGPGVGSSYSGEELLFEPYCSSTLAKLYPLYYTNISVGKALPFVVVLGNLVAITATLLIRSIAKSDRGFSPEVKSEIHSIYLGFLVKTSTALIGSLALLGVFLIVGSLGTDQNIFNEAWFDDQKTLLYFGMGPATMLLSILAVFFEGVVFTYAVVKHEVMGIDEHLRKTFTATIFAGLGAVAITVGSEMIEEVFGVGWIGGVLIGLMIVALYKPIVEAISHLSDALLPESHTKEELLYLQLYSVAVDGGSISPKERAMLNVQAHSNGLSEKRVKHLENWYNNNV